MGRGRIAVVGSSLAGLRACEGLRRRGYGGEVVLVGAERHVPYDRPPLSKELLRGEWPTGRIALRGEDLDDRSGLDDLDLDLRLGVAATGLQALESGWRVACGPSGEIDADGVVVATGATPRRLPTMPAVEGLFTLRTVEDALAIRSALGGDLPGLERPPRVAVVGGGFIGAEVAASARSMGLEVTVLEALPVPLSRVLGDEMGRACAGLHRDQGVQVRTSVVVEGFQAGRRVTGVRLSGGEVVMADVVVVGIGAVPVTDWLVGAGIELRDGVVCDRSLRVAAGLVAAGDVARWPHPRFGEMRLEHWTNAVESGLHAAGTLLADLAGEAPEPFAPVPYVWSDQYDATIAFVGHAERTDPVEVLAGSVEEGRFVAGYRRDGELVGALALSWPRKLAQARKLLAASASWADARDELAS